MAAIKAHTYTPGEGRGREWHTASKRQYVHLIHTPGEVRGSKLPKRETREQMTTRMYQTHAHTHIHACTRTQQTNTRPAGAHHFTPDRRAAPTQAPDGEKVQDEVVGPTPHILERLANVREVAGTEGVHQVDKVCHCTLQAAEVLIELRVAKSPDDESDFLFCGRRNRRHRYCWALPAKPLAYKHAVEAEGRR